MNRQYINKRGQIVRNPNFWDKVAKELEYNLKPSNSTTKQEPKNPCPYCQKMKEGKPCQQQTN
jgi:hypothetical protein